jgi:Cytochrome P460
MNFVRMAVGVVAATAGLAGSLHPGAQPPEPVIPFPEGYRQWVHVKTTLVGPQSPAYERNGGFHHFYGNEKAMEGYRTGTWPEGAVLVDDGLEAKEAAGVTSDGVRRRVAIMLRDSRRFAGTGGWGFEVFKGDGTEGSLGAEGRAACFACHTKGRDCVFSEFRLAGR